MNKNEEKVKLFSQGVKTGDYEPLNEYYRKNPPDLVIDDLGIFHEVEIPLPAFYKRKACSCGIIHIWEIPETFELYHFELSDLAKKMGHKPKILKQCKKCGEVLGLERYRGPNEEV
jgi:hypothetical protein